MGVVARLAGSRRDYTIPFTVFGHGEPLFDATAISNTGSPNVWITLHEKATNLGVWTPFSWYSGIAPTRWGAVVHDVDTAALDATLDTILDRGSRALWVWTFIARQVTTFIMLFL